MKSERKKEKKMKTPHAKSILSLFVLVISGSMLLSACQGNAAAPGIPLVGTLWLMESYRNAQGQTMPAQPGSQATITFEDPDRIFGNTTCNQYNGTYQLDGNKLDLTPGAMTMMACVDPALAGQESDFLAALSDTATYKIQGEQLLLLDQAGATVLTFKVLHPSALAGTNWQVTVYNNGKEALVSVLASSEITALFSEDGKLSGLAGCNNYNATYDVDGNSLSIGPAATTRKFCGDPEGLMEQESAYLKALESVKSYEISADILTLKDANGTTLVKYSAQ
jgi:heat shock protein HslJ